MRLYEIIRKEHDQGVSIRELARRHRVHRRDVREALASAKPAERKVAVRARPALGGHEETIRGWLRADRDVSRKQRHTARRVWQRLVEEEGAQVAESTVRQVVRELRAELAGELGRVSVVQEHPEGAEAECDFGEFVAFVAGVRLLLHLFVLRLSCSGRAYAGVFTHQAMEAFFAGHVAAFEHFGGVPGRIRYDNLKPAVTRMLIGRDRVENERFVLLRSHYLFDSFFCLPGIEGAHEKGGVEGEVGRFRRRHLVPVPRVDSMAQLRAQISAALVADDRRRIGHRAETVGEAFAVEAPSLRALPDERFDSARMLSVKADRKARVCVLQAHYSVPARLAGRRLAVRLDAEQLEILGPTGAVVAVHDRSAHKHVQHLVLDHYLELLAHKPGALAGSSALAQARAEGLFSDTHERFWAAARRAHGDAAGTRALIEVLLLHRRLPAAEVIAGMQAALRAGSSDAALVAIEARRSVQAPLAEVIVLHPDREGLPADERPPPSLDGYDSLLARPDADLESCDTDPLMPLDADPLTPSDADSPGPSGTRGAQR